MALYTTNTDTQEIRNIIDSVLQSNFPETVHHKLAVDCVPIRQLSAEKLGERGEYPKLTRIAQYCISRNVIELHISSIVNYVSINFSFFRNKVTIHESARVYIMFLIAHELKHARQFKLEGLTQEDYDQHRVYRNNPYELAANSFANNALRSTDSFQQSILRVINGELKLIWDATFEIENQFLNRNLNAAK